MKRLKGLRAANVAGTRELIRLAGLYLGFLVDRLRQHGFGIWEIPYDERVSAGVPGRARAALAPTGCGSMIELHAAGAQHRGVA